MKVLCKYYANNARIAAGIMAFSAEPSFRFFCLDGAISKNKGQFKAMTERVTVFVSCISQKTKKNLMVLLTNDPVYKDHNGEPYELDFKSAGNVYFTLCQLLLEKHLITNNPFEIDFAGNSEVATIAPTYEDGKKAVLTCCLKGVGGEAITTGNEAIKSILVCHADLKRFSYTTASEEVEKSVSVRKSRGEMLREVSHYLNRTVVLVSFMEDDKLLEQYVSATSVLEVYTKQDGTRFYKKISPIVLKNTTPFCLYLTAASVDDIMREQGRSLKKV